MRRQNEQNTAAACHFVNAIPIWGLVACGIIWFHSRESSRFVVAHARQAMIFHGAFLAAVLACLFIKLFTVLIAIIFPTTGDLLDWINRIFASILLAVYVVICLWGGFRLMSGDPFRYPLVSEPKADDADTML